MKKLFTIAALALLALTATAQGYTYQQRQDPQANDSYAREFSIYYGLRLGLSVATVNSDEKALDGGGGQAGLVLGGVMGFQLSPASPVYLEAGLFYTEKGGKGNSDKTKYTYDMNYLEMPVVVKYKIETIFDFSVSPFFGGYLAYGISGKMKDLYERQSSSSFASDRFRRFDAGLRLGCGIEYKALYAEMAYDWGLYNVCHDDFDKSHTGCFYLSAGVNF